MGPLFINSTAAEWSNADRGAGGIATKHPYLQEVMPAPIGRGRTSHVWTFSIRGNCGDTSKLLNHPIGTHDRGVSGQVVSVTDADPVRS